MGALDDPAAWQQDEAGGAGRAVTTVILNVAERLGPADEFATADPPT
ncbi:hypothetical protein AB0E59_42445 [Lentzea sp. NPDC034063]